MNGNQTTNVPENATKWDIDAWESLLIPFEIINLILLIVTIWSFLSLVFFGTKTKRWRLQPGKSSLNSGMVYTACTVAVGLVFPTLLITEILYHLIDIEHGLEWCEFVCDAGNLCFYGNLSAAYMFLWLRMKLIYSHPYVKERVWKHATYFIFFVFIVLALVSVGLMGFYVIPGSYQGESYGCTHRPKVPGKFWQGTEKNILLSVLLFFAQSLMMVLAVYPAVKVKFEVNGDSESDKIEPRRASFLLTKFANNPRGSVRIKSPIELAVRRTLISCALMVTSDILALLPVIFVLSRDAPAQLRRTMYNIGSFVNIFCMISTFGFAQRVLTSFCTSLPKPCDKTISRSAPGKYEASATVVVGH